ncbi:hypothetical protein [Deefgea sp. CFH1-16]|uniref:hypothetical protein n=1 Tax=Deefgea sp. CFH1-16 TaxID=2675457 RepID=UPI0015F54BEE|nr:hypothetical protein [Deefgea sp. CFH1-16]MBM5575756.1 hypothetical protein [Deefgea sp. CFH1-16]
MALLQNKSLSDIPPQDLPFLYAFAVYGKGLGQTRVIELLKRVALVNPFESAIALDIPSVKATLGRLLIAKWIKNDVVGFELNDGLQWPLLAQLNEHGTLLDWVNAAVQTKPVVQYWESTSRQSYATLCVFSALLGDESLLTSDLEAFSTSGMSLAALEQHPVHFFFDHPLGVRHFSTLTAEVQALLLVNFLYFASSLLAPAKAQYDYALNHCTTLKGVLPNFVSILAWQAHLRGDQTAFEHLAKLLNPNALSEADTANRLSRGDFASAIHRFGLLIEQIKKTQQ